MSTLVYFASGNYNEKYQELPFDRIFLVDTIFRRNDLNQKGKVTLIGKDCLASVAYFKENNILIDYFISLNEGLGEGGGSYPINSDMFLGYVMPILKNVYYHMMYPGYYNFHYKTRMDLPYKKTIIKAGDPNYYNPMMFSTYDYNKKALIYKMQKTVDVQSIFTIEKMKIALINDSIWSYHAKLDHLFISIKDQGQGNFFHDIANVKMIDVYTPTKKILEYCQEFKLETIGLTPWMRGNYKEFTESIKEWDGEFPKEINLYYLNQNDFQFFKKGIAKTND
jgi:hypothetical protein